MVLDTGSKGLQLPVHLPGGLHNMHILPVSNEGKLARIAGCSVLLNEFLNGGEPLSWIDVDR